MAVTGALALPRPAAVSAERVARRLPRPQSLPVTATTTATAQAGERGVGRTELGLISVAETVVARLASRAAVEVEDVGSAAPRLLGKDLSGSGLAKLGAKTSQLGALPACSAQVDGHLAFLELTISVRYPAAVRQVAAAVREQVREQVGRMTGLQVAEVDIKVPALVREHPRPARVH